MRRLCSRRLLWALAVSLGLHLLLVMNTEFSLPDWFRENDRIEVMLMHPPAPKPPPQPAKRPATPIAKAGTRKPLPPVPAPQPAPPPPPLSAPSVVTPELAGNETPILSEARPAPEPIPEPILPIAIEEEPLAPVTPPKRVEIEFGGFNGSKGKGKQTFELLPEGHYKLTAEMSMPVILFISGSLEQRSEGIITPKGLQPEVFFQKTTGGKPQLANFDWSVGRVTLDTGKRIDSQELPPGTQDFLSFIYQFMFTPPLEEMRLNIVTGKKLRTYVYQFEGEELLQTKMGNLRTLHIGKSSADSEEKTEIWLATEHRHLPIRIRKTDKDGSAIDLIATRLNITE